MPTPGSPTSASVTVTAAAVAFEAGAPGFHEQIHNARLQAHCNLAGKRGSEAFVLDRRAVDEEPACAPEIDHAMPPARLEVELTVPPRDLHSLQDQIAGVVAPHGHRTRRNGQDGELAWT